MTESITAHVSHFENLEQQHEASTLGMWLFLVTEVLFFGGMLTAYLVYRTVYPAVFADASRHLFAIFGTVNTAVLLCSSLTMALAVHGVQTGNRRALVGFLVLTMVLGAAFLGIKAFEYYKDYSEQIVPGLHYAYDGLDPQKAQLFFFLYFVMTGIHALHLTIGIILVGVIAYRSWRGHFSAESHSGVELMGLYWHFVDIVWVFLYPLLYLIDLHK